MAALLLAAAMPTPTAVAQTAQELAPGQAVRLSGPGAALHPVGDGRLASYGVESLVTSLAFTSQAGSGSEAVMAAPGAQLVVLQVLTSQHLGNTDDTVANGPVSLSVTSGTTSAPLPVRTDIFPGVDEGYFAAAVPTGGPATLTLSVSGLVPQSLDLRTGKRLGTPPVALYRAADAPAVEVDSTALSSFSGSVDSAGAGPAGAATGQFGVASAFLSYWKPVSTTLASDPTKAFFDVEFARSELALPGGDPSQISPVGPLPAGSVTFHLPDGQVIPATTDTDPTQLIDLLSGDYYAEIPADTSSVKVTVNLSSVPIQNLSDPLTAQDLTLHVATPLSQEVALPPPVAIGSAALHGPAASPRTAPPVLRAAGRSKSGGGSLVPALLAVLAALIVAGSAAAFWMRRRSSVLAATPVRWPPPRLSPAASRLLERGPAGTLPPGDSGHPASALDDSPHGATASEQSLVRDPTLPSPGPTDPAAPGASVAGLDPGGSAPAGRAPAPGGAGPALVVNVLGPLQVEGLVGPIRRRSVRRLLIALALTPERPLGADELAMIISDRSDRDPSTKSLHSYASILRRSLPAGVLPEAGPDGYRLDPTAVVVDWAVLAAVSGQPADRPGWAETADAALELVRGQPLEGGLWEGIEAAARTMAARVEDLAHRRAELALRTGDPGAAEAAADRGLTASPAATRLWQDRLDAAAAGSGYGLERAWADARSALGADAGLLAAHYQSLRHRLDADPTTTA